MAIYQEYASVYDRAGHYEFSLAMIDYLTKVLNRHETKEQTMLDLACGTGTLAVAMAQEGWSVIGVDGSEAMLEQARIKSRGASVDVTWRQEDMRDLSVDRPVALVTCVYDSLNYILESDDLAKVFRNVYRSLTKGGRFIFDMNTAYALSELWGDQAYVSEHPGLTRIALIGYNRRRQRTTIKIICFVKEGDLYRKLSEVHKEQAYPREHVDTLLCDAGFDIEAAYDCFSFDPPDDDSGRILWVARRSR